MGMPKCMIEIEGRTVLSRLISNLEPHVASIHVVVGYREEMVMEYCARHHRDVVLVRNPDYRTTNTAHSLSLGARHINGKVLYLDGDLLLCSRGLANFLEAARSREILVGLTDAKSENAVFVRGEGSLESFRIDEFTRDVPDAYEWANVLAGPPDLLHGAQGYVYERLAEHLPLEGRVLELAEVDTPADLDAAKAFVRTRNDG